MSWEYVTQFRKRGSCRPSVDFATALLHLKLCIENEKNLAVQEMPEQPTDLEQFHRLTELNFAMIRAKTGRGYYVNPYYIAAWSNVFLVSQSFKTKFQVAATVNLLQT